MSRSLFIIATRPEGVGLTEAVSWGVPMAERPRQGGVFTDAFGHGEMREIGALCWSAAAQEIRAKSWANAGVGDVITILALARRLSRPGPDWHHWRTRPQDRYIFVARPLTDYGDDIALFAQVGDYVPATWVTHAPHETQEAQVGTGVDA